VEAWTVEISMDLDSPVFGLSTGTSNKVIG
jgi:hypothetical protein